MKRWHKVSLFTLFILTGLCLVFIFKVFTPPIFGRGAIAELLPLKVNGDKQYLLIRGHDREQPVLLFLHGGPGMPAMFLAHAFQRELEKEFVVVHWDQRGSGKSFQDDINPDSLSISQLIADADVVVDYLRTRLG